MQPIYLTFDDGPDPHWTPRILDVLAHAQVRATFFAIGQQALRHPALVRRIVSDGHALGNHSFAHRHPWTLSPAAARAEVRDGARALSDVIGARVALFRPPYGRLRACMTDEARCQGQRLVLWDRSAVDWGWLGRAPRVARRLEQAQAEEIVLMHDGRNRRNRPDQLLCVLQPFLNSLRRRGLQPRAAPAAVAAARSD